MGTIDAAELEATLQELIEALSPLPANWPALEEAVREQIAMRHLDEDAQERLVELRQRKRRAGDLYFAGDWSWERYTEEKARLEEEIERLERVTSGDEVNVRELAEAMRNVATLMKKAPAAAQKGLLPALFARLEVDLDTGELYYWPAGLIEAAVELARREPNAHGGLRTHSSRPPYSP